MRRSVVAGGMCAALRSRKKKKSSNFTAKTGRRCPTRNGCSFIVESGLTRWWGSSVVDCFHCRRSDCDGARVRDSGRVLARPCLSWASGCDRRRWLRFFAACAGIVKRFFVNELASSLTCPPANRNPHHVVQSSPRVFTGFFSPMNIQMNDPLKSWWKLSISFLVNRFVFY